MKKLTGCLVTTDYPLLEELRYEYTRIVISFNLKCRKGHGLMYYFICFRMWWTITGNFGNILPIDWSKSYSRKVHMPALNLKQPRVSPLAKSLNTIGSSE